jgi:hypothetical protein
MIVKVHDSSLLMKSNRKFADALFFVAQKTRARHEIAI